MKKKTDVFADNTVVENEKAQAARSKTSNATSEPGGKTFKSKSGHRGSGFAEVPGAGENPGKLDR